MTDSAIRMDHGSLELDRPADAGRETVPVSATVGSVSFRYSSRLVYPSPSRSPAWSDGSFGSSPKCFSHRSSMPSLSASRMLDPAWRLGHPPTSSCESMIAPRCSRMRLMIRRSTASRRGRVAPAWSRTASRARRASCVSTGGFVSNGRSERMQRELERGPGRADMGCELPSQDASTPETASSLYVARARS